MKEIIAIIRANKIQKTKEALADAGFPSLTANRIMGRGKQKGLQMEFYPPLTAKPDDTDKGHKISFIPKRMISMVVPDENVENLVQIIIQSNQTGNIGDGRIFICPINEAIRVRTGEKGDKALN